MTRKLTGLLLALALVLPACMVVDSGDNISRDIYNLGGDWAGWLEDDLGGDHDFSMTIDHSGHMTAAYIDTGLQPYVGNIVQDTAEGFRILFSAGGGAVMVVDDTVSHCVYFDANGAFGVLQKSPPVSWSDLFTNPVGDWNGFAYIYDTIAGGFLRYSPWDITIADGGTTLPFAGIDDQNTAFGGALTSFDSYYGWYAGYINVPWSLDIVGGLSPDKQFFGAYIGDIGVDAWPNGYWFLLMTRQ